MADISYNTCMKKINFPKPRGIIHTKISKPLTAIQKRTYDYFCLEAKKQLNYWSKDEHYKFLVEDWKKGEYKTIPSFEIKIDYLKNLPFAKKNATNKEIYKMIKELEDVVIVEFNILKKDEEKNIVLMEELEKQFNDFDDISSVTINRLISNVRIDFRKGIINLSLPPKLTTYLISPYMYVNYNVLAANYLPTSYSISLYQFLLDIFKNAKRKNDELNQVETGEIEIEKLREIFGISKTKYKEYKDFKKYILKKSVDYLNKSDVVEFKTEFIETKIKRKVTYVNFILTQKPIEEISEVLYNESSKKIEKIPKIELISGKAKKEEFTVSEKLIELREKIISEKINFTMFKNKLLEISNSNICNNVPEYPKHYILRTNDLGHLEFYVPDENRTITFSTDNKEDLKELIKIKTWLFRNPERIGKIEEIDTELEKAKSIFLNKYYFFQNKLFYCFFIKEVEREEDVIVLKGDDIIEGVKNIKIKIKISEMEKYKSFLKTECNEKFINDYIDINRSIKEKELKEFFEKNREEYLEKFRDYLNKEYEKLSKEFEKEENKKNKDENKIDKIGFTMNSINDKLINIELLLSGLDEEANVDLSFLQSFKEFVKK